MLPDLLDLRETAIDEEFRPGDVAAVVGGEKDHGPCNLVGRSQSAERNAAGDHLPALLARLRGSEQATQPRCVDRARTHRVDADATLLQVRRPGPRERTDGRLRGAVDAVR